MARCEIPTKASPPSHPFTQQTVPVLQNSIIKIMQEKNLKFGFNPQSFHVFFFNQRPQEIIKNHPCTPSGPWGESVWRGGPEDGGGRSRQFSRPRKRSVREPSLEGRCWNFVGGGFVEWLLGRFVFLFVAWWNFGDGLMRWCIRRRNMYISCRLYMSSLCYLSTFVYTDTDISVSFV